MSSNQQTKNKQKIFEGLRGLDLRDLIDEQISIDRYKSKMGTDDEVVVLAFKCLHNEAAIDLVEFIESGYQWVLDANMSPATDETGKVTVFVEFNRRTNTPKNILSLLEEVNYLCGDQEWNFLYYKNECSVPVNEENLSNIVPDSPKKYRDNLMREQELDNLMSVSGLNPETRHKKPLNDQSKFFIKSISNISKKSK